MNSRPAYIQDLYQKIKGDVYDDPKYMQRALEREGVKIKEDKVVDFKKLFWHPSENLL